MKCPKCGSEIVKKVHVLRPDWAVGLHECFSCDFKGDWTDFGGHPFSAKLADTGVRPKYTTEDFERPTKVAVGDD